jgi:hypothetical protein
MSSYGATGDVTTFKVEPDGSFYPNVVRGADRRFRYRCTALFASLADRNAMRRKVTTDVTFKDSLGSTDYNTHVTSGYGPGALVIAEYGGASGTYQAVLVDFGNVKGYGRFANPEFMADLDFILTTMPS